MMNWWCEKGIDGFRMDVISMISKDPSYPDGKVSDGVYGDLSPYVCNGPRVHEYLQEMNRKVLSKYDLLTVGETPSVTVSEAKKYANKEGTELNMVFQFEHTDGAANSKAVIGKWTINGRQGWREAPGEVSTGTITISRARSPASEMTIRSGGCFLPRCWRASCI